MAATNFAFKLLSLNARGIRSFEKRKAVGIWMGNETTSRHLLYSGNL